MLIDEQDQVFLVERAEVEQQSRALAGPEAQGDVFSSQRDVRVAGWGQGSSFLSAQIIWLLEDIGDRCCRLKGSRYL